MSEFVHIPVKILEVTNTSQPGWVACELVDADNHVHRIVDKFPIFTGDSLITANLPHQGTLRCKVTARYRDLADREVIRVTSTVPDGVKTADGLTEFEILAVQLSEQAH